MINKLIVGYYRKPFGPETLQVELARVLKSFTGNNFRGIVLQARELYENGRLDEYSTFKNGLPAVTFSGVFSPKRVALNLQKYSGLIILDLDKVGENLLQVKKNIFDDEHVIAIWISPSGDGLKFLIKTNATADEHKLYYKNALKYFNEKYDIEIDKSGSDISRLCFVSYDADLLFRQDFKIFDHLEMLTSKSKKGEVSEVVELNRNSVAFYDIDTGNQKKLLKKIYHYLKKRGLSITNSHSEWVRVAFAISNTFSFEVGRRFFLEFCRLDGPRHDEKRSEELIALCFKKGSSLISFKTILYLAREKGYEIGFKQKSKKQSN